MVVDIFNTDKKYNVIYADPPWRYGDRKCNGACEFHYNTMTLQEIKDLPVARLCEKDCVLFLWTTYPMLREALQVIEAWGVKYKKHRFSVAKAEPIREGLLFRAGKMDTGKYGTVPVSSQRETVKAK